MSIIAAIRARQRSPDQSVRDASHLGRIQCSSRSKRRPTQAIERVKAKIHIRSRYENFIGGQWVPPVKGQYFQNTTPINGQVVCEVARSSAEDIEVALDAAHKAKTAWGKTSPANRAAALLKIADRMEAFIPEIATIETIDNGKPIRETMAADIPLAVDHFRYFAGCLRAQEGSICEIDDDHRRLPLPRAARRRRPDHSVELPAADGRAGSWLRRSPPATASC